jgi:predicted GNAT family acetyltransferase
MATEVRHRPEASRYEVLLDGRVVGVADYADRGDVLVFHHTEIDAPLRGRGLGAELVRFALDDLRARPLDPSHVLVRGGIRRGAPGIRGPHRGRCRVTPSFDPR